MPIAHIRILSARCDFFEDKFAALQKKPPLVISFGNMYDEGLELLVDLIYLGECQVPA